MKGVHDTLPQFKLNFFVLLMALSQSYRASYPLLIESNIYIFDGYFEGPILYGAPNLAVKRRSSAFLKPGLREALWI